MGLDHIQDDMIKAQPKGPVDSAEDLARSCMGGEPQRRCGGWKECVPGLSARGFYRLRIGHFLHLNAESPPCHSPPSTENGA
jgi:hypothetical protein